MCPRSEKLEADQVRGRSGLAGEHDAAFELAGLQGVVDVHLDGALHHAGPAGAADAALARVRGVRSAGEDGVQDGPVVTVDRQGAGPAIEQ